MYEVGGVLGQAELSLTRLLPRVQAAFEDEGGRPAEWPQFEQRLRREWPRLFGLLLELYGTQYDFFYHLEQLLVGAAASWHRRAGWLKRRDEAREAAPEWFQSEAMLGGVVYV